MYKIIKKLPVARFYYKGSHSHPIRRTILIIWSSSTYISGYEVREGSVVRSIKEAPIKTYAKKKIAKFNQLGKNKHRQPGPEESTLNRSDISEFLFIGP